MKYIIKTQDSVKEKDVDTFIISGGYITLCYTDDTVDIFLFEDIISIEATLEESIKNKDYRYALKRFEEHLETKVFSLFFNVVAFIFTMYGILGNCMRFVFFGLTMITLLIILDAISLYETFQAIKHGRKEDDI